MKTGDPRLALVWRGVSLGRLISAKPRTGALITTPRRFAPINHVLQKMSAQSSGTPPMRQIQFVRPVYAQPPDRVDFVSWISIAEPQCMRLRRIVHASETQELQFQNTMIEPLNHANQRRLRASEVFFEDIIKMEWEFNMFFLFLSERQNINKTYGHPPSSNQPASAAAVSQW